MIYYNLMVSENFSDKTCHTYPNATGLWILVFTRSSGWNIMVEQVPLKEPAMKDFITGDWNREKYHGSFIFFLIFHKMISKRFSYASATSALWLVTFFSPKGYKMKNENENGLPVWTRNKIGWNLVFLLNFERYQIYQIWKGPYFVNNKDWF